MLSFVSVFFDCEYVCAIFGLILFIFKLIFQATRSRRRSWKEKEDQMKTENMWANFFFSIIFTWNVWHIQNNQNFAVLHLFLYCMCDKKLKNYLDANNRTELNTIWSLQMQVAHWQVHKLHRLWGETEIKIRATHQNTHMTFVKYTRVEWNCLNRIIQSILWFHDTM